MAEEGEEVKRPEWMTSISANVKAEDYMLGRKVDKTFELSQQEKADKAREARIELIANNRIKLSHDPILDLERRRHELKMELIRNPVRLKQFRERLLQMDREKQHSAQPGHETDKSENGTIQSTQVHEGSDRSSERVSPVALSSSRLQRPSVERPDIDHHSERRRSEKTHRDRDDGNRNHAHRHGHHRERDRSSSRRHDDRRGGNRPERYRDEAGERERQRSRSHREHHRSRHDSRDRRRSRSRSSSPRNRRRSRERHHH